MLRAVRPHVLWAVFTVAVGVVIVAILRDAPGRTGSVPQTASVWESDASCVPTQGADMGSGVESAWRGAVGFFTNHGSYMPRTDCMVTAEGGTDWVWVWLSIGLTLIVITGYLRIFAFWRRSFLAEEPRDRNHKLMDLAWIFLLCAVCGYVSSIVLFVWPAYRLLAIMLVPLAFFTWRFAWNLEGFRSALAARRLERELRESLERRNDELEQLVSQATEELVRARVEAERANNAKSVFLANMSHEIRTPMTAIIGYTDILLEPGVEQRDREEYTQTVRRNAEHLLNLINDILDLSKVESGKIEFEYTDCDPGAIVGEVAQLLGPRAEAKGIHIRTEIGDGFATPVVSDPTRLRQIVTNLLGNAVKFTERGWVSVRLFRSEAGGHDASLPIPAGVMVLQVEDTGIGMTPEQCQRCFEPFSQADPSMTRRFGGTGLGLSISRKLARSLGGDLIARARDGGGTVFTAWLRLEYAGSAESAGSDRTPSRVGDDAGPPADLRGLRVLVAEDGIDNQRLIRYHLGRAGAQLEMVSDGSQAVQAVRAAAERGTPYDLVLMDMQMPVMDGLEATRRIRAAGHAPVIVALSAHAMESHAALSMEAGCDAHIAKPPNFGELIALCRRLHTERSGRRAAA